jgi:hypothetical protein
MSKSDDQYPPDEARQRFEAALRGSRKVGHVPMKSMTPKKAKDQPKPDKKSKASVQVAFFAI